MILSAHVRIVCNQGQSSSRPVTSASVETNESGSQFGQVLIGQLIVLPKRHSGIGCEPTDLYPVDVSFHFFLEELEQVHQGEARSRRVFLGDLAGVDDCRRIDADHPGAGAQRASRPDGWSFPAPECQIDPARLDSVEDLFLQEHPIQHTIGFEEPVPGNA